MDRILLRGIPCKIRVGVSTEERQRPQACLVDVELEHDLRRATETDDLQDTLDYAVVYDLVQGLASEEEFALLERFAGRLEEELRNAMEFGGLVIRVQKLQPPLAGEIGFAGVEIHRP